MSAPFASAIYAGLVQHQRLKPRKHRLRYRVFWLNVDIDELPALDRELRLFSLNRFNLFSLVERDYGPRDGTPLRAHVEATLREAGVDGAHRITLFTMPRIFGYAFNPLSIYFCHDAAGRLAALLYEVSNTFGQRHSYLIPVEDNAASGDVRQGVDKTFYVSPFIDMAMRYAFRVKAPAARVSVSIIVSDARSPVLSASLSGARRDFTDRALARLLFTHPLLTMKVVAGIHWEALKLWLKGVRLKDRPAAPAHAITAVTRRASGKILHDNRHLQPHRG